MNRLRGKLKTRKLWPAKTMVIGGILFGSIVFSPQLFALSDNSPQPGDYSAGTDNRGISHLLKYETQDGTAGGNVIAKILDTNVDVYYPSASAGKLKIYYKIYNDPNLLTDNDRRCNLNATTENGTIDVRLSGAGATRHYPVRANKVCASRLNAQNQPRDNVLSGASGVANNKFFANYDMPTPVWDSSTGKYKVTVRINYAITPGTNNNGSVNFGLNAPGGIISPTGSVDAKEFGFRSAYFTETPKRDVRLSVQFGKPCSISNQEARVKLYDADTNAFGPTYLWVEEDGHPIGKPRYNPIKSERVGNFNSSNGRWQSTAGSNSDSILWFDGFKHNSKYSLHVYNPISADPDDFSPNSNVLSISIPYDSIFGQVDCNYNYEPHVTVTPKIYMYYPSLLVTSTVSGHNGPTDSEDHNWRTYVAKYSPGSSTTMGEGDEFNLAPGDICNRRVPSSGRTSCNFIGNERYPDSGASKPYAYSSATPDPVGTKICFFSVFQRPQVNKSTGYETYDDTWRYSSMDCSISAKQPKVQVLGSDLKVRGAISTSASTTRAPDGSTKTFGSWVEYGIFSTSSNIVASSGAGLKNGNPSNAKADWSKLTFANKLNQPTDAYGNYSPLSLSTAMNWFGNLSETSTTYTAPDTGVYRVGNLTLDSSTNMPTVPKGRSVIIQSSGTVTINDDINVDGAGLNRIQDISQVVIVAKDIVIAGGVGNVDAWLLASNSINTCSDVNVAVPLTSNQCTNPLIVNGAVTTPNLYLRRTAGADAANPQSPAETFRLRPDAQLWAYNYANKGDRAQTVYVTELPPRF